MDQVIGNVWVPKNPETLTYDEDGNLIQDSRWAYRWDAENRLKEMETLSGLATNVPVQKLVFTYDHQGRRASKAVHVWDEPSTNYLLSSLTRFVYDGWNLLAELDVPQGTNAPVLTKSFLWGLDLSGTPDQAGGIGGLLAVSQHSTNALSTHFPAFDANGNVMSLVHAGSGQPSARYEYAPFGEPLRVTGDAALLNPFRFSTKYTDDETGLLYYGYRYYSPTLAKWLNRDPLEEEGGLNLYAFVQNNPITRIDALGHSLMDAGLAGSIGSSLQGSYDGGVEATGNRLKDIIRGIQEGKMEEEIVFDIIGDAISGAIAGAAMSKFAGWADDFLKTGNVMPQKGGLNLYRWNDPTSTRATGWNEGDRFLFVPWQGSAQATWKLNSGMLRKEMNNGNPIFDSYRDAATGQLIQKGGMLGAERLLLESRGWKYNSGTGAWCPP